MLLRTVVLGLSLLLAAGCASGPAPAAPDADPLAGAPADLTIDLIIQAGRDAVGREAAEDRNARFIVFPDGSFHAAYGDDVNEHTFPPRIRRLSQTQLTDLWGLVRELGLNDAERGEPVRPLEVDPDRYRIATVLTIRADGRPWTFTRLRDAAEPADPALRVFTRRLAAYAWAADYPVERIAETPRRYDFGPDPYARYRR